MAPPTPRHHIRRALATTGALALGSVLLGLGTAGPAQAAAPTAQVWITTPDGSDALTPRGGVPFTSTAEGIDIAVDPGQRFQRFTGAGASVTEASAHLISSLPQEERDALMRSLFSRGGDGIGLNYLRQPLGSTDFNAGSFYTYEDTPGQFGIDRDQQEIIPVLRDALAVNPDIRFMGSPWSPPAWMKTGGSLNGGGLDPDHYGDYADYLVSAIEAYGDEGVELSDLTVANEPLFATSYPSTSMSAAEQAAFFHVLDGALTAAGLPTDLYAYDHNWDRPDYALEVFEDTRGIGRVQGAAFHCYGGQPEAQSRVVDAGKRVFFTECSGTDSADPDRTFADTLRWHSENLVVRNMRNGGETVVNWNLALDAEGGPHQGHCEDRCNGVVEIDGTHVTRGAEYYVLGHLTKFTDAGAIRLGSTSQGPGGVQNVVFENPDGTRVAYVANTGSASRTFSITDGGDSLSYTLPAGSVATFTWTPNGDGGDPGGPGEAIASDTPYQVVGADSGKCLDAADWGTGNGADLQQWECGSPEQANQTWRFLPTDSGHYQVVNEHAGTAWDVEGGSGATADGTRVQLWDHTGGTNQQWLPEEVSDGTYRFVARHSGKCLTPDGGSDGSRLAQQPCDDTAAQSFRLNGTG